MASKCFSLFTFLFGLSLLLSLVSSQQLSVDYYKKTCPNVDSIVRRVTKNATSLQTYGRLGAEFHFFTALRLFFNDCFSTGCDASNLLGMEEDSDPFEDTRPANALILIDRAKSAIDAVPQCANKVSCADVMALVARDIIALSGGPNYRVELGRRDGLLKDTDSQIPSSLSDLDALTSTFAAKGLSLTDMVALSGAHTIGYTQCVEIDDRLFKFNNTYKGVHMNHTYWKQLRSFCPSDPETDQLQAVTVLDPITPKKFDNQYYKNLILEMGTLSSDQVLYNDLRSRKLVELFAHDNAAFEQAFVSGMTKLGRIGVLTGEQGQIRVSCTRVN